MSDSLAFPFVMSLAFVGLGVTTAVDVLPRAGMDDFFTVESITAKRVGDTAILDVERTLKQPIHMQFTVRTFQKVPFGYVETCSMSSGVILYEPGRVLPELVTLDWWTWGECPTLPDGPAMIETTWTPEPRGMKPLTVKTEVDG